MKVKNLGLLYKAKHYLDKGSLLMLYYYFIHTLITEILLGKVLIQQTLKNEQSTKAFHSDHTL